MGLKLVGDDSPKLVSANTRPVVKKPGTAAVPRNGVKNLHWFLRESIKLLCRMLTMCFRCVYVLVYLGSMLFWFSYSWAANRRAPYRKPRTKTLAPLYWIHLSVTAALMQIKRSRLFTTRDSVN